MTQEWRNSNGAGCQIQSVSVFRVTHLVPWYPAGYRRIFFANTRISIDYPTDVIIQCCLYDSIPPFV